jgi:hypothetical protein
VLRQLLQQNKKSETSLKILRQLAKLLITDNGIEAPTARSSIVWLIGEFYHPLREVSSDILRILASDFVNEHTKTKTQIMNFAIKLALHKPDNECVQSLMTYILEMSRYDVDTDLRDRARFMTAVMGLAPSQEDDGQLGTGSADQAAHESALAELTNHTPGILLAHKLPPVTLLGSVDVEGIPNFTLGTLSSLVGHRVPGYETLASWPAVQPNPSIRDASRFEDLKVRKVVETSSTSSSEEDDLALFYDKSTKPSGSASARRRSESSSSDDDSVNSSSSNTSGSSESSSSESSESSDTSNSSTSSEKTQTKRHFVAGTARASLDQLSTKAPSATFHSSSTNTVSNTSNTAAVTVKQSIRKVTSKSMRQENFGGSSSELLLPLPISTNSNIDNNNLPRDINLHEEPNSTSSLISVSSSTDDLSFLKGYPSPTAHMSNDIMDLSGVSIAPQQRMQNTGLEDLLMTNESKLLSSNALFTPSTSMPTTASASSHTAIPIVSTGSMSSSRLLMAPQSPASGIASIPASSQPRNAPELLENEHLSKERVLLRPELSSGLRVSILLRYGVVPLSLNDSNSAYVVLKNEKDFIFRRIKISFPAEIRKSSIPDIPILEPGQELWVPLEIALANLNG